MKTTQLFNIAKIFSLAFVVFFSACTESEDPVPNDPNQPDTGLPDVPSGGNGGGLPGGGGNPDGGLPGGGTTGGGNGPLGGGGQQPTSSNAIGVLSAGGQLYEYTNYSHQTQGQANEQGTFPIALAYYDEESNRDGDPELFDTGNTAAIVYNAAQAGTVVPGTQQYNIQSNTNPVAFVFFGNQGSGYILTEGEIAIEATQESGILLITVTGQAVQVDEAFENVLSDPFAVEAQFLAPAQLNINARQQKSLEISADMIDALR